VTVRRLVKTGIVVGCGALVGRAVWERLSSSDGPDPVSGSVYRDTLGWRLYDAAAAAADRCVGWDKLPTPLGLAVLIGLRNILRQENLYDTSGEPAVDTPPVPPLEPAFLVARTPEGVYNDLDRPSMGMASSRFGRNVPLEATRREPDALLMEPNPRTVSRELLTRTEFIPARSLNLFAASWIQFMIRDWFSHGHGDPAHTYELPLEQGDPWPAPPLTVLRTLPDTTRPPDATFPLTYLNTLTHWWDGSQLYGTNPTAEGFVRSHTGGKLNVGADGVVPLPTDPEHDPHLVPGWWLGLQMLVNLFTLEHNAICDRLIAEYPSWTDEQLFQRARLILSALLAKIHTVEWTPAVIAHPTMEIAMRANWYGIAGERVKRAFGRISASEVISGIPGSKQDHFGVPYSLTEEFTIVYRMHPLIADDYSFRSAADGHELEQRTLRELSGPGSQPVLERIGMRDLLYSFGTANPGAIVLNNFPRFLQEFQRPDGKLMDIAATDILRSRELGVPRYNEFRRLLHLRPARDFSDLTDDPELAQRMRSLYVDIERLDAIVGMFAEKPPEKFAFSDTAFRIFILMASRRINSDRFLTNDYTASTYTQTGIDWVESTRFVDVMQRHYPDLAPSLRELANGFKPWSPVGGAGAGA
jgi:Animal haem peroxidase